jgi:hypothetical protein
MGDITPTTAVLELAKLSRQLDLLGLSIHDAEREATNTKHVADVERAKAFLAAEGSVQAREAQAVVATADLRLSAELAAAELRIIRSDIRTVESRIDVGRSVVGVLRAEAQVAQ